MTEQKQRLSSIRKAFSQSAGFVSQLFVMRDYMLFVGLGLAGYGASLVYPPAGFIIAGGALASVAIFGVR